MAAGAFVYVRFESDLLDAVDAGLRARADALLSSPGAPAVEVEAPAGLLAEPDDAFAQVVGADGRVVASSSGIEGPLLAGGVVSIRGRRFLDASVRTSEGETIPARLLAVPFDEGTLLVGASVDDQHESLERLATLLAIGGPVALGVVVAIVWWIVGLALRPVERAIERERRFVDDASHELRTPLGNLKAELDLALRRSRSREELVAAIRSASEEVDRVATLADDLLVLARADRGLLAVHREPVDVVKLLVEAVEPFRAVASARGVEIRIESGDGVRADVDERHLRRAVGNLVDNAIRHSPPGGVVTIGATHRDGAVHVLVHDGGDGFAPGSLPGVFEAFARPDGARSRSEGGAGLGLAIVRAIAEAHGGTAEGRNAPDGGAVVELSIPAGRLGQP